jgi:biotin transport system substrate-specific component
LTLRLLLLSSFFAILTAISSIFIIPLPFVPMTLQVAVMLLSGLLLGVRGGAISQAFYVLLGLIGLPVFAGGVGGIQHIFSPTFGFLLGFIAASATTGLFAQRAKKFYSCLLACLTGVAAMYTTALPLLFINLKFVAGMDISFIKLLQIGLLPFLVPDIIKACAAAAVAVRLKSVFYIYGKDNDRK